jgi:multicomponent Na+:H+ antiporter subunit F
VQPLLVTLLSGVVLAMGLAALRLLRGPTLADRVMALDVLVIAAVGGVALVAWQTGRAVFLDVAVAVAMVTFISAVGLAWYLDQKGEP